MFLFMFPFMSFNVFLSSHLLLIPAVNFFVFLSHLSSLAEHHFPFFVFATFALFQALLNLCSARPFVTHRVLLLTIHSVYEHISVALKTTDNGFLTSGVWR